MRLAGDAFLDAAIEDHILRATGVVEPDEPTPFTHYLYMTDLRAAMRTCPHFHSCIACSGESQPTTTEGQS